ncbi:methionyl-tRNA formyltransferase [Halobellus limi]|nr:methionyl-tRNA formyltransferase [Halobellus limi]
MRVYDWLCDKKNVFVHSLLTTKDQLEVIKETQPDYVVSCGYRHIVPEEILNIPNEGCLNLHPAYLPYNRGANPNVWSIVEGTPAGVTLHWMDPGIDTGNIIAQQKVGTDFSDDGKDLNEKLEDAQVELFQKVWPDVVKEEVTGRCQNEDEGTYHRTNEFDDLCELNPDEEVRVKDFLDRLRALTYPPYDNAEIEVDGETYYIEVDITK